MEPRATSLAEPVQRSKQPERPLLARTAVADNSTTRKTDCIMGDGIGSDFLTPASRDRSEVILPFVDGRVRCRWPMSLPSLTAASPWSLCWSAGGNQRRSELINHLCAHLASNSTRVIRIATSGAGSVDVRCFCNLLVAAVRAGTIASDDPAEGLSRRPRQPPCRRAKPHLDRRGCRRLDRLRHLPSWSAWQLPVSAQPRRIQALLLGSHALQPRLAGNRAGLRSSGSTNFHPRASTPLPVEAAYPGRCCLRSPPSAALPVSW